MTVLSAIVVDHRGGPLLERCLADLRVALTAVEGETELIVVDNGGHAGAVADAEVVVLPSNRGFAGGVAAGLERVRGEWVALVNNDAFLEADCLRRLLAAGASAPDVGSVTGQVRFEARPELVNTAGLEIDALGIGSDRLAGAPVAAAAGDAPIEVFGVSGCVALYRRSMLDAIGGFDASFFAFQEDADVAWRARAAGWRALYEPRAIALHRGSATAGEASAMKFFLVGRNRVRLLAKNATRAQLARHGAGIVLYDLAYVVFVAVAERTLAPLRGRVAGLREWRAYRAAGAPTRRPVALGRGGWRKALAMRRGYAAGAPR